MYMLVYMYAYKYVYINPMHHVLCQISFLLCMVVNTLSTECIANNWNFKLNVIKFSISTICDVCLSALHKQIDVNTSKTQMVYSYRLCHPHKQTHEIVYW